MTELTTVANGMGEAIKKFREAAVTSENKATPMARSILAAMLSGVASPDKVTAAVIASFGNPKSPKTGKPVAKLSGLRDFVGGDATRKTVESIFKVAENVKGHDELTKLVTAFVLNAANAPKSLRALEIAVKDTLRADAAKDMGTENTDAETNVDGGEAGNDNAAGTPLADKINMLALEIAGTSDDDFRAISENVAALRKAIADRMDQFTMSALKVING